MKSFTEYSYQLHHSHNSYTYMNQEQHQLTQLNVFPPLKTGFTQPMQREQRFMLALSYVHTLSEEALIMTG